MNVFKPQRLHPAGQWRWEQCLLEHLSRSHTHTHTHTGGWSVAAWALTPCISTSKSSYWCSLTDLILQQPERCRLHQTHITDEERTENTPTYTQDFLIFLPEHGQYACWSVLGYILGGVTSHDCSAAPRTSLVVFWGLSSPLGKHPPSHLH